ncbi:TPA: endonuclease MutS2, partial [Streptococcus pneumoniae]|nr:endonuclease MutS2 [Streptococcus pneumoniae]
ADLNIEEFLLLKRVLLASRELQSFYANLENVSLEELAFWFEKLHDFPQLQGNLQAFNDAGFIENFASEELARIRRKIHDSESQVRDVLQDLLKQKAQMLTEGIVASRNGRQVLPVKNTYRNKIAGVVHDISASGNTVYIEPREVVKLSEEIASLRADERYEMLRILQEISERVR